MRIDPITQPVETAERDLITPNHRSGADKDALIFQSERVV